MKKIIILIVTIMALFTNVNAQSFNNETSGFSYEINYEASGNIENIIDTLYNVSAVITMIDINQISKIMIILKDDETENTITSTSIDLSNVGDFPDNITFNINDSVAIIGVGEYTVMKPLKFTILLQDIDGSISDPIVQSTSQE